MSSEAIAASALEPLYEPWEIPNRHRARSEGEVVAPRDGRRRSPLPLVQGLRAAVAEWRDLDYLGATDTTRYLFHHWFHRDHHVTGSDGVAYPFNYYFCQREAIETLAFLYEVRHVRSTSKLLYDFLPGSEAEKEREALGIDPDDDKWARYAFKVATGAGKTKVMSLAIVWSYFNALRESDSAMTKNFLLIAPGITVFERLKEDFRPEGGGGSVFDTDPLIPSEWRGDWNMSVVLQDEAAGESAGGTIYLTNIHRLYEKRRSRKVNEFHEWVGPAVNTATALDIGAELRERISGHESVMVLNDEAHHVWDSDNAWSQALEFVGATTRLISQLDFSATPKDDRGRFFRHIIVDTPLGEAVDAGIVKTPILGQSDQLVERSHDNAAWRYENHLLLGYERWKASDAEWRESGKKVLLFIMAESSEAADQIAHRLNTDETFEELNGKTVNLHTNLKGKFIGRGANRRWVEDEKSISDEDLNELRRMSRELDSNSSPYRAIVSVLMLREGWDVKNVTTIVPLRALSAENQILPEQALGRGLRRMTVPGSAGAAETVTVIEHPSFVKMYQEQLGQEGLSIVTTDPEKVPPTSVTVYVDRARKDVAELDIAIPQLTQGYRTDTALDEISFADVERAFHALGVEPLKVGEGEDVRELTFEGRHLITNEVLQRLEIKVPLLRAPGGAMTYFVQEIEAICRVKGTHPMLAPLVQQFLERMVFGQTVSVYAPKIVSRLNEQDVRSYVRAVFVPIVRERITTKESRVKQADPKLISNWRPFQATHSERRPAIEATRTGFNLVPCDSSLEVAMSQFLDNASDVAAFARNAGPQALRVDYLSVGGRRALYTPDFIVRSASGTHYVIETKGRVDLDVPLKARAAQEWCNAASKSGHASWRYLYVPQNTFRQFEGGDLTMLDATCAGDLAALVNEADTEQLTLSAEIERAAEAPDSTLLDDIIPRKKLDALPKRYQRAITDAMDLFEFIKRKDEPSFGAVFQPMLGSLDDAAETLMQHALLPLMPTDRAAQHEWFEVNATSLAPRQRRQLEKTGGLLKRLLVHDNGMMPIGLLRDCLTFAGSPQDVESGVLDGVAERFEKLAESKLPDVVQSVYDFRNNYVAHARPDAHLGDEDAAHAALQRWVVLLEALWRVVQPAAAVA